MTVMVNIPKSLTIILYIILPILSAGITFIMVLRLKILDFLSYPLDSRLQFRGKRIFGNNKTFRGPFVMSLGTALYGWLLNIILKNPLDLKVTELLANFFLVGLSYSLGELPNSFFKRQLGIPPGKVSKNPVQKIIFKFADTFDSLIFCGFAYAILFKFPIFLIAVSVALGGILHLTTDQLMIMLSLKSKA